MTKYEYLFIINIFISYIPKYQKGLVRLEAIIKHLSITLFPRFKQFILLIYILQQTTYKLSK